MADVTLDGLHEDLLRRIIDGCLGGRDAARLACVSKLLKDAVMTSKWPPWSPEPHILADGTVCEPLSGRYSVYVRPGDGWARVCQVIGDAPEATVLMMAGDYEATETLILRRPVYIFGAGATVWGREQSAKTAVFACTASRGALVNLSAVTTTSGFVATVRVPLGAFRLQRCVFSAAENCTAVAVTGTNARPTIVGCSVRGGYFGVRFYDGAGGALIGCDVRRCGVGVAIAGSGDRTGLRIEGNEVHGTAQGVLIAAGVDRGFRLGTGNVIRGDVRDVKDDRALDD